MLRNSKEILPDQDQRIADILVASRGNHKEITDFLHEADRRERLSNAYQLLETLAEKDLRDTPKSVLDDHLYFSPEGECSLYHVACPRVDTELLRPYRSISRPTYLSLLQTPW